jgi:hypothetical protein
MERLLRVLVVAVFAAVLTTSAAGSSDGSSTEEKKAAKESRPALSLRASPSISFAPVRVNARAELKGGPDDFEELYCPSIEWDWGDGTVSESTPGCDPFVAGKSEIDRFMAKEHVYREPGEFRLSIKLKKRDKVVASAGTSIQVNNGLGGAAGEIIR